MTHYPDIEFKKITSGRYDQFMVTEDCLVSRMQLPDGTTRDLMIPAGFVTNLASVPRWLWWLIPPMGLSCNASILHDYMYRYVRYYMDTVSSIRARLAVDAEYMKYLILTPGMPVWQAILMFFGVHVGGKKYWSEYEKEATTYPPTP